MLGYLVVATRNRFVRMHSQIERFFPRDDHAMFNNVFFSAEEAALAQVDLFNRDSGASAAALQPGC